MRWRQERLAANSSTEAGQDSFLDIVANIVGILIILVMVVGVRASQAPSHAAEPTAESVPDIGSEQAAQVASLASEVQDLNWQAQQLQQEVAMRRQARQQSETLLLAVDHELDRQRTQLDAQSREEFDQQRQLTEAHAELDRLTIEQISLDSNPTTATKIVNLPSPLSQTVLGREAHFQIRGGRITSIPIDDLMSQFKSAAKNQLWKLDGQSRMTDIVGPVGGFRLRYELERREIPLEVQREPGRTGTIIQLVRWELIPVSSQLGETLQDALAEGSEFDRTIAEFRPHSTTVTIWTYPDSFADFRAVKEKLYAKGYPTAGRPLRAGVPIAGSPQGTRSAAQ